MNKLLFLSFALILAPTAHAKTVGEVCEFITSYSTASGVECITAISSGGAFDAKAVNLCSDIATSSVATGLACVKAIKDVTFQADAVDACSFIASYSSAQGIECIGAISNKVFLNGSAALCLDAARSSTAAGVTCLKQAGTAAAKPTCATMKDVKTAVDAALDAIYAGSPRNAVALLQGLDQKLATCTQ